MPEVIEGLSFAEMVQQAVDAQQEAFERFKAMTPSEQKQYVLDEDKKMEEVHALLRELGAGGPIAVQIDTSK